MANRDQQKSPIHVHKEFVCDAILEESVAKLAANSKSSTKWRSRTVIAEPMDTKTTSDDSSEEPQ